MEKILPILIVVLLLAGCSNAPTETEYFIEGERVSEAPKDATIIPSDNSTINDLDFVQETVQFRNDTKRIEINASQYRRAEDAFEQLPLYTYSDGHEEYDVLYVSTENETVRLRIYKNVYA